MSDDNGKKRWVYYRSAADVSVVKKEIRKAGLNQAEVAALAVVMRRVETGNTVAGDVDHLGDGVLEVRARCGGRRMRLLYAEEGGERLLLALVFVAKKDQPRVPRSIELAKSRLREHRARSGNR